MSRIGILGGTFDPPHLGHLIIAEAVRTELKLDEVWFVPTHTPPHKSDTNTGTTHRLNMLKLATRSNPFFVVKTTEIDRAGTSYTYDTVKDFKTNYPNSTFYFIIGSDMVEQLSNWHQIEALLKMVTFVGVNREGANLKSPYSIKFVHVPTVRISSSFIRTKLVQLDSVRYLVPKAVEGYIEEHKLYGS